MYFTKERIEELNKKRLADKRLDSKLVHSVNEIISIAKAAGFDLLVAVAFRTVAEQNALYAQGRTKKGKVVTNAKGMQSKHCQGKACDLVFIVNGDVSWDWKYYKLLGDWAQGAGVTWGGNFNHLKDGDHVEV
jgi:peptidoglycan L-alanyl-D-glutamate endopeptidase CwlK